MRHVRCQGNQLKKDKLMCVTNIIWGLEAEIRLRIGGSVVEFSPATRETGVRFPANAALLRLLKVSSSKIQ